MTDSQKIELFRAYIQFDAACPCCQKLDVCNQDCTFKEDDVYAYEKMQKAREVLRIAE